MATTSKWCSASRRRAAALPLHPVPLAATPPAGKIVQAVVERLFAWMSRYRRHNIVYDRAPDLFAAHIWIAMISIISRRLVAGSPASGMAKA